MLRFSNNQLSEEAAGIIGQSTAGILSGQSPGNAIILSAYSHAFASDLQVLRMHLQLESAPKFAESAFDSNYKPKERRELIKDYKDYEERRNEGNTTASEGYRFLRAGIRDLIVEPFRLVRDQFNEATDFGKKLSSDTSEQ